MDKFNCARADRLTQGNNCLWSQFSNSATRTTRSKYVIWITNDTYLEESSTRYDIGINQ